MNFNKLAYMKNGFTLIELLVVIGVIIILAAATAPIYGNLQVSAQLNENSSKIIQAIRIAREQSQAGFNGLNHGVYFEINAGANDKFILYQGSSYAARDINYDQETILDDSLSLSSADFFLTGGDDVDINFSKGLGAPDNIGALILTHETVGSRRITLNPIGMVEED